MITFYHDIEQDSDHLGFNPEDCKKMVAEFIHIESEYGIKATYNVVGRIIEEQPELIKQIADHGHEIAFHSYFHTNDPNNYAVEVERCAKVSKAIKGYRSPRSEWSSLTLDTLWNEGLLWNAENDSATEPYFIHKGLVRLPIANDDWPLHTKEMTTEQWIAHFNGFLNRKGTYFGWGSHDCVTSAKPEERLKAWETVLRLARENNELIVTFGQAADLFRRAALSEYYSDTAKDWNEINKGFYRTARLKELIRRETEALKNPVVVDLGSAGGLLSAQLVDIADKIYCVDNAPGMVKDLEKNKRIIGHLGDVTKSNLPDDCADFVIATRVVEYLYSPEQLANEIRKIGKEGAKYFVSFPAAQKNQSARNEGPSPPDKIRKLFTAEEIIQWTRSVGPGRLMGIQYDPKEPSDAREIERFKQIEAEPPQGIEPQNWVFVGTVQKDFAGSVSTLESIPVSAFKFTFLTTKVPVSVKYLGRLFPRSIRKFVKKILRSA